MCLNRKLLRNPKLNPTGLDKPTIKVDCGKCPDCLKSRSNDWFVRSYFEIFGDVIKKDLFLITLDFDDAHLPLYRPHVGIIQSASKSIQPPFWRDAPDLISCFDNEEIQAFLSRLRYYVPPFRYLCVPEYGGFLQRPHYHILFIFPCYALMDVMRLRYFVGKCWFAGTHFDVSEESSCGRDPLKMVRYIVNYCTKDFSFDLDKKEEKLPYKYRPRIMSSGHYGACALGKQITFDVLKNQGFVVIDGKKFQIPRYYEQKLCYDYRWSSEEKKAYRPLNELGKDLAKDRHRKHTCHYVKSFFASRYDKIHLDSSVTEVFNYLYPDSPYNGMKWRDIVFDVMSDYKRFVNYVNYKDFMYLERCNYMRKNQRYKKYSVYRPALNSIYDVRATSIIDGEIIYTRPYSARSGVECEYDKYFGREYDLCIQACFMYDLAQMKLVERQHFIKLYKQQENQKKRAWEKIKRHPELARYLKIKGFDFTKLYHMSYRDYYELNNSNRLNYVQQVSAFED